MAEPHAPTRVRSFGLLGPDATRDALIHALVVPLLFALLFTIFFSPVVFTGRLLAPGDGTHFFVPNFYSPRVWWDVLVWVGTPRFADPSAMFWYPPHLVCRLLPQGWNIFMLSAYVVAASATYGYVYGLTRSRFSAAVSGTTYALCGFMIAHSVHASMIHAAAWLPLFVWSLEELRRFDGLREKVWFVVGALSIALCALAGHPQIFLYTLALGGALAIFRARGATSGASRYLALCAALVVIGACLAAVQLAPTVELSRLTPRAAINFESFTAYQLPLRQLPTFIFPLVFGGAPHTSYALPYFGAWGSEGGGWNASEVTGYVGLLPLLLAAIAVVSRHKQRLVLIWLGVAAVALILALGSGVPLARITYHLPLFNKFRAPARHLLELSFAVSVLSGLGINAITRGVVTTRQIKRVIICAFALALFTLLALALARGWFDAQARAIVGHAVSLAPWKNPATGVPLFVLLASSVVMLCWSRRTTSRARAVALFVVLIFDMGSLGWFSEWRVASPTFAEFVPPPAAARLRDALTQSGQRVLAVRGGLGANDEGPPEQSRLWKIPSAGGYGPLMLARMSRLLAMLPHGAVANNWADNSDRSLDLAAVRYVTLPRDDAPTDDAKMSDTTRATDPSALDSQRMGPPGDVILWGDDLNIVLGKGCNAARESESFTLPAHARATHLAFVTQLACADQIADGAHVLSITLRDEAGHTSELKLDAGRDTSEWAYDCADVRARVRHSRAPVFSTYTTDRPPAPCAGHDYASEIATRAPFEIKTIELRWTGDNGSLSIKKLSIVDRERNLSSPVTAASAALGDATRWRLAEETNGTRVYENLRAQPRAWLASEVLTIAPDDALKAIKTSRLPDGGLFDPARTALVEEPQNFSTANDGTQSQSADASTRDDDVRAQGAARIVEESDWKMEVRTESASPSFLVLSDAYYPGWHASVDGQESHVYQTDYAMRGVHMTAGAHVVRFGLRPRSFRVGLIVSLCALAVLALFSAPFNPLWKIGGATTKEARR
ncbi:MAG: hypothetical protein QOE33_1106 [Acidobacteriota bacterium]|nr:hypothetical protein [Acidobacteriota bacterium]